MARKLFASFSSRFITGQRTRLAPLQKMKKTPSATAREEVEEEIAEADRPQRQRLRDGDALDTADVAHLPVGLGVAGWLLWAVHAGLTHDDRRGDAHGPVPVPVVSWTDFNSGFDRNCASADFWKGSRA